MTTSANIGLGIVRWVSIVALMVVFVYWTYGAVLKFKSKPVSTQVAFKYGDDNMGNISLPAVTFCNKNYQKTNHCSGNSSAPFIELADACIAALNSTDAFLKWIKYDNPLTGDIHQRGFDFEGMQSRVWTSLVHPEFGYCYTFDVALEERFTVVPMSDITGNPGIDFKVKKSAPMYELKVLLHDRFDVSEAHILYPGFDMATYGYDYEVSVVKRVIQSISTQSNPCQKFAKKSCLQRHQYKAILEGAGCELVYFRDGAYLQDLRPSQSRICNGSEHAMASDKFLSPHLIKSFLLQCPSKQACNQTKLSIQISVTEKPDNETSTFTLVYADPMVVYNIDAFIYDAQSLIGEVGGTLGLTIGLSFLSIADYVILSLFPKAMTFLP